MATEIKIPTMSETPAVMPEVKVAEKTLTNPALTNPSNWDLKLLDVVGEEQFVSAVNNETRDTFVGTIENFNKILRG